MCTLRSGRSAKAWRQSPGGTPQGGVFVRLGFLKLVHDMVMLAGPFVLQQLLRNLQSGGSRCAL